MRSSAATHWDEIWFMHDNLPSFTNLLNLLNLLHACSSQRDLVSQSGSFFGFPSCEPCIPSRYRFAWWSHRTVVFLSHMACEIQKKNAACCHDKTSFKSGAPVRVYHADPCSTVITVTSLAVGFMLRLHVAAGICSKLETCWNCNCKR